MRELAEEFLKERAISAERYTIEESTAGVTILFTAENGLEYVCLIEDDKLRREIISLLREKGAKILRLPI